MSYEPLAIIARSYELYKLLLDLNDHAEKRWRYSLCMTTEKNTLDMIGNLFMAQHAPKKSTAPFLLKAVAQHEILSFHVRIYMERGVANQTQLYQLHGLVRDVGRQLGGWLAASHHA
jgi:hypothetical protein